MRGGKWKLLLPRGMDTMSDQHLRAVYRVAKTRLRPWFADPRTMQALRNLMKQRGLDDDQRV